jgi:hypothetical protein
VNDTSLPLSQHERDVLKWCQLAVEEGEAFLKSCPGYHDFDPTIKAIMGEPDNPTQPLGVQAPTLNHFGKVALDMTAALTDIKPFWDYRTSNERFNDQSQMANKLSLSWWVRRNIDLKHSDVVKYALAMGTGYAHSVFNPDIEDLDVIPEDPRDVIPIRPASFITIQDSMGVMIRRERTVNYLRARWPLKASQIKPDRDGSHAQQPRVQQLLSQMQSAFMSNLFASLGGRPKQQMNIPTTDEFTFTSKTIQRTKQVRRSGWASALTVASATGAIASSRGRSCTRGSDASSSPGPPCSTTTLRSTGTGCSR